MSAEKIIPSDLDIAQSAPIHHIKEIAVKINVSNDDLQYYGDRKSVV